jgi:hypothetical protein
LCIPIRTTQEAASDEWAAKFAAVKQFSELLPQAEKALPAHEILHKVVDLSAEIDPRSLINQIVLASR